MSGLNQLNDDAETIESIKAMFLAKTDKKVHAQKLEIHRLTKQVEELKKTIKNMNESSPYKQHKIEVSRLYATIAIQRKAIDDRQEWVNKLAMVLKESEGMI